MQITRSDFLFVRRFTHFSLLLTVMFHVHQPLAVADGDNLSIDDNKQDEYVIYRKSPLEGYWFLKSPYTGNVYQYQWGLASDIPVPGSYTDDKHPDLAVYRPSSGVWFLRQWDSNLQYSQSKQVQWGGLAGDIPVPCDYNGDGFQDLGVYRNGSWYIIYASGFNKTSPKILTWGTAGDIPVPREYDSDSKCDAAIYRPSNGTFYVLLSSTDNKLTASVSLGGPGDVPMPGNYDGDRLADFAVFRPGVTSQWIVSKSTTQRLITINLPWGVATDTPVASDFDGDGRLDLGVWRPSDGTWYYLKSYSEFKIVGVQQFGLSSAFGIDVPIAQVRAPSSYK